MNESFAEKVAARLRAEIPGVKIHVDYSAERGSIMLHGRYACPCAEISGFGQEFYKIDVFDPAAVPYVVDHLKHMLREHVRGEGNQPNF